MPQRVEFEGQVVEFPDDATDEEIAAALSSPAPSAAPAAPAALALPAGFPEQSARPAAPAAPSRTLAETILGLGANKAQGVNVGLADLAGLPVDLANNLPGLLDSLPMPGADRASFGRSTFTDRPFMGGESIRRGAAKIRDALGGGEVVPTTAGERIAGRVGQEIGATMIPLGGALAAGARLGREGVKAAGPLTRYFTEPAVHAPGRLVGSEMAYGAAAGAGAGGANELANNPQRGDNMWSDFFGSLAGAIGLKTGSSVVGAGQRAAATVMGKPQWFDDTAGKIVTDQIIDSSTGLRQQFNETGTIDVDPLVERLRTPAPVEEVVPGYHADIADRSMDPGLQVLAFNESRARPGADNARRQANERVVDERIEELRPAGSAGAFRASLETGRDRVVAEVNDAIRATGTQAETAAERLAPTMGTEERGAVIRGSLADRLEQARVEERAAYQGIEGDTPVLPLVERMEQTLRALPGPHQNMVADTLGDLNSARRFLPNIEDEAERAAAHAAATMPISEVTALRSALTTRQRQALSEDNPDRARVLGQFVDQIDDYLGTAAPTEIRDQYENARRVSFGLNERFTRPTDPVAQVLRENQGRPRVPDSAVASKFVQPDDRQASNVNRALTESGGDPVVRTALRDQVLAEIDKKDLLANPAGLDRYLRQRGTVLGQFPGLEDEVRQAAGVRTYATGVARAADNIETDLTRPGRSATASYLKYDDTRTVDSVRSVLNAARPREAAQELIQMAGRSPQNLENARTAFWKVLDTDGKRNTPEKQWSAKQLSNALNDEKTMAVARELYADRPEVLDDMKRVFDTLATAETGGRLGRAPGSPGTAQSLSGKFDPAMSASSIASRLRSVNRGQLSPGIAIIDVATTWLRRRKADVQSAGIQGLKDRVIQNPELAADLLEKYNPATWEASRRKILSKYGVRATQIINMIDEEREEEKEPVKGVIASANR